MAGYGPASMVQTPWGTAAELRERRLRPGPGTPREEVARSQRERLFGAMVASVAAKGYEATTVADLLELSGVSRSAFYEHFRDKEECFLAAFDATVERALGLLGEGLGHDGASADRERGALARLVRLIVAQPAAARMCLIEAYGAGKAGHAAIERALNSFLPLAEEAIARAGGHEGLPREMVRGLLGGVQTVIQDYLRREETDALPDVIPDLWDWALTYRPPPKQLRLAGRRPRPGAGPPPFAGHNQAERIIRALAAAAAERGYPAVTIAEIAARASVSQATFYSHFADKETALVAALDSAGSQALAAVMPAGRRAPDWPHGVRAAIGALCDFGAAEPDLMRLGAIEAYATGNRAFELRSRLIATMSATLAPGFDLAPTGTRPIVADAVLGTAWSLLYQQIAAEGAQSLPSAAPLVSYMVLAPFLGAERAVELANGDGRRGG